MALKAKAQKTDETVEETTEETTKVEKSTAPKTKPAKTKEVATKEDAGAVVEHDPAKASVFITNPDFIEAVSDANYGDFPSIVASNGSHEVAGESSDDLGKVVKFQAIVAKPVFKLIPGVDDEESKDYFQVSTDGETVPDGRSLEEALEDAVEAGYENAAIKEYVDVTALIVESGNDDYVGETVVFQLAPSSKWNWSKLEKKVKMKAALRKLEATPIAGNPELGTAVVFTSTAVSAKVQGSSKTYTKFEYTID